MSQRTLQAVMDLAVCSRDKEAGRLRILERQRRHGAQGSGAPAAVLTMRERLHGNGAQGSGARSCGRGWGEAGELGGREIINQITENQCGVDEGSGGKRRTWTI